MNTKDIDSVSAPEIPLIELLLALGRILFHNGATARRVRESILFLNKYLNGPEIRMLITYAGLIITTVDGKEYRTVIDKSPEFGGVNIAAVRYISQFLHNLDKMTDRPSRNWIHEKLTAIAAERHYKNNLLGGSMAGIAGVATGALNGADNIILPIIFIASLGAYWCRQKLVASGYNLLVSILLAVVFGGLIAVAGSYIVHTTTPLVAIIAPMLFLVPAFPFITGGIDILHNHNLVGICRICFAITTALLITAGLSLAMMFAPEHMSLTMAQSHSAVWLKVLEEGLWAGAAAVGLAAINNASRKSLWLFACCGFLARLIRAICMSYFAFPAHTASFIGILIVTFIAIRIEMQSIVINKHQYSVPAILLAIISAIPMFPGFSAINGLEGLMAIARQTSSTLTPMLLNDTLLFFVKTILTIFALLIGILLPLTLQKDRTRV
ncbi:MAG: threonine/serine exporter family protein [Lentisphaerota bacterium]